MVKLFAEKKELLVEFLSSIIFEGPMASNISVTNEKVVETGVITVTPEGIVQCRMFDKFTRENIFLDIAFQASIKGENTALVEVAFPDLPLIKDIISNFQKGETVTWDYDPEDNTMQFYDATGKTTITEECCDPKSIPAYDPDVAKLMKWDGDFPMIGDSKAFDVSFKMDHEPLRMIEKMNKTLGTPSIKVRLSDGQVFLISGDFNGKRSNLFNASVAEFKVNKGGKWVEGTADGENEYPIGIIPVLKALDNAECFVRKVGDKTEQILFRGERGGIKKVYFIGAAAKGD